MGAQAPPRPPRPAPAHCAGAAPGPLRPCAPVSATAEASAVRRSRRGEAPRNGASAPARAPFANGSPGPAGDGSSKGRPASQRPTLLLGPEKKKKKERGKVKKLGLSASPPGSRRGPAHSPRPEERGWRGAGGGPDARGGGRSGAGLRARGRPPPVPTSRGRPERRRRPTQGARTTGCTWTGSERHAAETLLSCLHRPWPVMDAHGPRRTRRHARTPP